MHVSWSDPERYIVFHSYCAQKLFLSFSDPEAGTLCGGMLPWAFLKLLCPDGFLPFTEWCLLCGLFGLCSGKGFSSLLGTLFVFGFFSPISERVQLAGLSCLGASSAGVCWSPWAAPLEQAGQNRPAACSKREDNGSRASLFLVASASQL